MCIRSAALVVSLALPGSLLYLRVYNAAEYTAKERNMLFMHTIGYISSGRAQHGDDRARSYVCVVSLARTQMGLELQDKVSGPSALSHALTSWDPPLNYAAGCQLSSRFALLFFFYFHFSSLSFVHPQYLRYHIWTVGSRNRASRKTISNVIECIRSLSSCTYLN